MQWDKGNPLPIARSPIYSPSLNKAQDSHAGAALLGMLGQAWFDKKLTSFCRKTHTCGLNSGGFVLCWLQISKSSMVKLFSLGRVQGGWKERRKRGGVEGREEGCKERRMKEWKKRGRERKKGKMKGMEGGRRKGERRGRKTKKRKKKRSKGGRKRRKERKGTNGKEKRRKKGRNEYSFSWWPWVFRKDILPS